MVLTVDGEERADAAEYAYDATDADPYGEDSGGTAETTVSAAAGGDAVTVEVTGLQELRAIKIKPEVVDPDDVETLEDLLVVAVNEAMEKAKELASQKFGALTGGLKIPGLF